MFDPPSCRTRARMTSSGTLVEATNEIKDQPNSLEAKPKLHYRVFEPPCRRTRSKLTSSDTQAKESKALFDFATKKQLRLASYTKLTNGGNNVSSSSSSSLSSLLQFASKAEHFSQSTRPCDSSIFSTSETSSCLTSSANGTPKDQTQPLGDIAFPSNLFPFKRNCVNHKRRIQAENPQENGHCSKNRTKHRRISRGGRPPPKPKLAPVTLLPTIQLSDPPEHPLPQDVAVLCFPKNSSAGDKTNEQWCQVIDRYRSCGDNWMYYVHYAGTDRRLDEWVDQDRIKLHSATSKLPEEFGDGTLATRSPEDQKFIEILQRTEKHMMFSHEYERNVITRTKTIDAIQLGSHEIRAWYFSPYPVRLDSSNRTLYICEYCLKYMASSKQLEKHFKKCRNRHPPGDEIYRDPSQCISVFEVSGRNERLYGQNLCLLAKMFLEHKTMYYDVQHFMFYVLCEYDPKPPSAGEGNVGFKFVGYFSKEKVEDWNLACILVLPPFQRKGYGRFLIQFSYELSKKEGKPGTPERPLSDLGRVSYFSYWKETLLAEIVKREGEHCSIKYLSMITAIKADDVLHTLQALNCLHTLIDGRIMIKIPPSLREEAQQSAKMAAKRLVVDVKRLHYFPPAVHHPKVQIDNLK
jgi:histone acetyltransferase MYST1